MIPQDVCAFYNDHALFDDYTGVVIEKLTGDRKGDMVDMRPAGLGKTRIKVVSTTESSWHRTGAFPTYQGDGNTRRA